MSSLRFGLASGIGHPARGLALAALLGALLAGCAAMGPLPGGADANPGIVAVAGTPVAGAVPPAGSAPGAAPSTPPAPATARPFADVIKDAKVIPGYFTLYQKDDKVWIEVLPAQFDQPFFFQINRNRTLGDRRLMIDPMLRGHIAQWHRLGDLVQLMAVNERFVARAGTAIARAVRENLSDSLIGAVPAASKPHPDRKSILLEANALLLADLPGAATHLEGAYRLPYAFDARNSGFTAVRASNA